MNQGNNSVYTPDVGDLIEGYVGLILIEKPDANVDIVRENVQEKISGLMAQEPFFLRAVLESGVLSNGDKLAMYIGVKTDRDGGERYPQKYHMGLIKKTQKLNAKGG